MGQVELAGEQSLPDELAAGGRHRGEGAKLQGIHSRDREVRLARLAVDRDIGQRHPPGGDHTLDGPDGLSCLRRHSGGEADAQDRRDGGDVADARGILAPAPAPAPGCGGGGHRSVAAGGRIGPRHL